MQDKKRSITPQKAIEILNNHGTTVTFEEAKIILDFMYNFAILSVNQLVKNKYSNSDGSKKYS
ncbi:hypothetical protein DHW03_01165 [Pedobacter yonginense]|jgi:hypothetical protein|uniref:Uncharacterized protein n=1 Tax=Pedobacter yonginense TaxID=651869 RepID=A0A317ERM4_9SPHI|nr:hypothetical protein DHW03_01165 [Pedobacter yonginense]